MKIVLTKKATVVSLFCAVLAGFAVFAVFFVRDFFSEKAKTALPEMGCVSGIEERIIRGNSLSGLIEDGQVVRVLFDYYDCNEVQKEDIILYDYAGSENSLIKIVKGIPGDNFFLKEADGGWHILINGETSKNSEGKPYLISGKRYEMLSLYQRDYKGIIPGQSYLIMGNLPGGAMDSTRYGLISKDAILAKAEAIGK